MIRQASKIPPSSYAECVLIGAGISSGAPVYTDGSAYFKNDGGRLIVCGAVTYESAQEIKEFAKFLGCGLLLSESGTSKLFGGELVQRGQTLKYESDLCVNIMPDAFPDYSQIYRLFCSEFDIADYDEFAVSLHRAVKSGAVKIYSNEHSVCIVTADGDSAFIRAVCTERGHRRHGYALRLVSAVMNNYKMTYLYKEFGKNDSFYKTAGFAECGEFEIRKLN